MLIRNRPQFHAEARQFTAGVALHEPELPAVALVAPAASLTRLYTVSRTRQQSYQLSRDGKRDAFDAQRDTRDTAVVFIGKSRDSLVPYLGPDWSESWAQVGFTQRSLALPARLPRLVDTLDALERYFKANPAQQTADLNLTEAFAKQARENLEVAVSTVARCKRDQRKQRDLREDADTALAAMLAVGRKVLAATLPEDDARWLDFRADVPGDLSRPEGVEGVHWVAGTPGHLLVRWQPATRGESYIVQAQVVGVDEVFRNVATVRDTTADIAVTPGAQVKLRVLARNASGPGVPSGEVTATVPPLVAVA